MIYQNKINSRRRSKPRVKKVQGLLEVKVRSDFAHRQRNVAILLGACKLLLGLALIGGAVYGVREVVNRMFLKNPEYNLAAVEIKDDGSALPRDFIQSTTGFRIGQNIFTVSLSKARGALMALPQVERVDIQRALPNKISVEIIERRPVAWVAEARTTDPSTSAKSFLIDAKGVLFKPMCRLPAYLRLPAIYGVPVEKYQPGGKLTSLEAVAALELVEKSSDGLRFRLQSVDISKGYCLIATDARRSKITFGLEEISRQLERLAAVLDYSDSQGKEIRSANLMVEKNIPVIFGDPNAADPDADAAQQVTTVAIAKTSPTPSTNKAGSGNKVSSKTTTKKTTSATQTAQRSDTVRRAEPVN